MNTQEILSTLKKLGKPQTAAIYRRHGSGEQVFGVLTSELLARSPIAEETMRAWMKSQDEFRREMGYGILAVRLKDDPDSVSDAEAARVLATIEKEIHRSPNWARYAMNGAEAQPVT